MRIELNPAEQDLKTEIEQNLEIIRKSFREKFDKDVSNEIDAMGDLAHRLHMLLKQRDLEPKHHGYMIENRGMQPDNPEFYEHVHPVEDLLAFLEDPHANDDPVDQTIGKQFKFKVYSRRWGHDDVYKIVRTAEGWDIHHLNIGGPCDRGGRPFLFQNLNHDSINYPSGLEDMMEALWELAASKGLSEDQVQKGLNDLANWVSSTEKKTPSGNYWEEA